MMEHYYLKSGRIWFRKSKKQNVLKKKGDPLMDPPLEPDEMETELLDDRENNELDPKKDLVE